MKLKAIFCSSLILIGLTACSGGFNGAPEPEDIENAVRGSFAITSRRGASVYNLECERAQEGRYICTYRASGVQATFENCVIKVGDTWRLERSRECL
tara:strand:- start:508 stop:798 length:291 start_codon:yes stop_codon:yes gene_type:complete